MVVSVSWLIRVVLFIIAGPLCFVSANSTFISVLIMFYSALDDFHVLQDLLKNPAHMFVIVVLNFHGQHFMNSNFKCQRTVTILHRH